MHTEDLPTSGGHPFCERLYRTLAQSRFDAFVAGLRTGFHAARLSSLNLQPGRYFGCCAWATARG